MMTFSGFNPTLTESLVRTVRAIVGTVTPLEIINAVAGVLATELCPLANSAVGLVKSVGAVCDTVTTVMVGLAGTVIALEVTT